MGNGKSCLRKTLKGKRSQKGGATYAVDVAKPITTASGVPLAVNAQIDPYCSWTTRGAQLGGSRRNRTQRQKRQQRGGSCGCGSQRLVGGSRMVGGGGGNGGYGFQLTNDLGKVYTSTPVGICPAQPVATPLVAQAGGMSPISATGTMAGPTPTASLSLISSYPSGYSLGHPYSTVNDSAHFLEPVRYDRSCMGGGSRSRQRKQKRQRQQRSLKQRS